ncbi:MAG: TonB family protein [Pyrinomonadaceae bacterium]
MLKFIHKRSLLVLILIFFCIMATVAQTTFPDVLEYVPPKYPAGALAVNAKGTVQVVAEVDSTGTVSSVKGFSGLPLLRRTAEVAVEKWKFSPLAGRHFLTISIHFRIGEQKGDIVTRRGPYHMDLLAERVRVYSK